MAAKPVKSESGLPNIAVTYDVDADVLFITNGEDTAFGDSIANGVAMFYDQDPGSAGGVGRGDAHNRRPGSPQALRGRYPASAWHRTVATRTHRGNGRELNG